MHCARWLTGSLAVLLSIAGCGGSEGDSAGLGEVESASHSWGGYHWARTANPFTLDMGDNVSSASFPWDAHLTLAASDWTASSVLNTAIVTGQSTRNCKPTSGRVEVCAQKYGYNGWLGIAGVWVSGGHITKAYVKMNDTYFAMPTYNTSAWRQLVMCQEIGHTLGLDHNDGNFNTTTVPGTCMDYTNDPSNSQHPNAHDYEQLETIYAHLDNTTTVGQALSGSSRLPPQANDNADPDDVGPPAWGRLVRRSADGKLEVYELDLGAGDKVIRFVRRP